MIYTMNFQINGKEFSVTNPLEENNSFVISTMMHRTKRNEYDKWVTLEVNLTVEQVIEVLKKLAS